MPRPVLEPSSRVVALLGIDGAGKTTAAKAVASELRARGVDARYLENAGGRPPLNSLARLLGRPDAVALLGRARFEAIEMRIRGLAMRRTLRWAARRPGRVAVGDRWTFCQYAVMAARGSDPAPARARYRGIPAPEVICFLDVDPTVAQRRVELRGRDTETLAHLASYDAAYRTLPEHPSFHRIDASGDRDAVVAQVLALLDPADAG